MQRLARIIPQPRRADMATCAECAWRIEATVVYAFDPIRHHSENGGADPSSRIHVVYAFDPIRHRAGESSARRTGGSMRRTPPSDSSRSFSLFTGLRPIGPSDTSLARGGTLQDSRKQPNTHLDSSASMRSDIAAHAARRRISVRSPSRCTVRVRVGSPAIATAMHTVPTGFSTLPPPGPAMPLTAMAARSARPARARRAPSPRRPVRSLRRAPR